MSPLLPFHLHLSEAITVYAKKGAHGSFSMPYAVVSFPTFYLAAFMKSSKITLFNSVWRIISGWNWYVRKYG